MFVMINFSKPISLNISQLSNFQCNKYLQSFISILLGSILLHNLLMILILYKQSSYIYTLL